MSTPTQDGSTNDPVTLAVLNNIMGTLPTRRPQVRCDDCDLDFTSQVVLDAHLQGSRHAKQIRCRTILASLEETNVSFSKDQETNGLKCNVCNVYLNSLQQLQTHLNGNRHKKKVSKGDWAEQDIVSPSIAMDGTPMQLSASYIPEPTITNKYLSCVPCNKIFNSDAQLKLHLASQKHKDKINKMNKLKRHTAKSIKKKKFIPHWKKVNNKDNPSTSSSSSENPLLMNFVSGGFENCT